MALHKDLTGANLHEPKGVAAATSGQVYRADGAGSGVWSTLVIPTGTFYVTIAEFTAGGTWTKPANLFLAKVTVIGAGGGGSGSTGSGAQGGTSSFGTTPFLSATGGNGGTVGGAAGTGGAGSNGDFNFTGRAGMVSDLASRVVGGCSALVHGIFGQGGFSNATASIGSGGGGGASIEWLTAAELTHATETVTVGTAGAAGTGGSAQAGGGGYVLVEEYISV